MGRRFQKCRDGSARLLKLEWFVPVTPGSTDYAEWEIRTLEGTMLAGPGDWIICDTEGKLYPCKPFVFERQYEPLP